LIPSWRKQKKLERQERQRSKDDYPPRLVSGIYCPNCGHRFDRTGHRFACH
jgi:hypothetical protein